MTRLYLLGLSLILLAIPGLASATTLHDAITADATGKNVAVADKGSVGVSITISGTATVTFKGSTDGGTTFDTVSCTVLGGTTTTTTATATGQYTCSVSGFTHFEAPVSGCSSCTVTVKALGQMSSAGGSGGAESSLLTSILASITDVWDTVNHAWKVTLATLISGEDQTNNLLMTSGGAVRQTQIVGTGGVPSTATDATGTAQVLPVGKKKFHGLMTCTGSCVQTMKVYGAQESSATVAKSVLVFTLEISGTTTANDWYTTDENYSYWFVVTSLTAGTTPLSSLMVMY